MIATLLAAVLTGVVAALLATFRWLAAGLGVIVPLWLLPGILFFLVSRSRQTSVRWSAFAYWIPNIIVCVWWGLVWLSKAEGSGLAFYMLVIFIPCAIVAYQVAKFAVYAATAK